MINKSALFGAAILMCAGTQAHAASPLDVGIGVISGIVLGSMLSHPAPVYAAPEVVYRAPPVAYEVAPPVYYAPPQPEYYYGPPAVIYHENHSCWHRCWHRDEDQE